MKMLKEIIDEKKMRAVAVWAQLPANANATGSVVSVWENEGERAKGDAAAMAKYHMLRQQKEKEDRSAPYYSLGDFVAPAPHKVGSLSPCSSPPPLLLLSSLLFSSLLFSSLLFSSPESLSPFCRLLFLGFAIYVVVRSPFPLCSLRSQHCLTRRESK